MRKIKNRKGFADKWDSKVTTTKPEESEKGKFLTYYGIFGKRSWFMVSSITSQIRIPLSQADAKPKSK